MHPLSDTIRHVKSWIPRKPLITPHNLLRVLDLIITAAIQIENQKFIQGELSD